MLDYVTKLGMGWQEKFLIATVLSILLELVDLLASLYLRLFHIDLIFLALLGALVFIDLVTGSWRARLEGRALVSRGFRKTVEKVGVYFLFVFAGAAFFNAFEGSPWESVVALFELGPVVYLGMIEFKSIAENVTGIRGARVVEQIQGLQRGNLGTSNEKPAGGGEA